MSRILGADWYTEMGSDEPIGIVITRNADDLSLQAYIGTGRGFDEQQDAILIAERGARFPLEAALALNIIPLEGGGHSE